MKRFSRIAMLAMALSLLIVMIAPASAITVGELAGEDHPKVVLVLMEVAGRPAFRCSGTLLSPTVVLTAGYCTNNFPGSPYTVVFPGFTGDFSLLLSNNHSTSGTCFGDSGGPNFLGDSQVVAGVTSFGLNGNCAGTGGVFRMDRQNVLDFVGSYLP